MTRTAKLGLWTICMLLVGCIHVEDKLRGYPYFDVQIQRGDSLSSLGRLFDVPWRLIAEINEMSPSHILIPGQVLKIPQTEKAWQSKPVRDRLAMHSSLSERNTAPRRASIQSAANKNLEFGAQGSLYWPVKGPISSHFGPRSGRVHQGIDIRAAIGTPIRAAASGRVIFSGWQKGYGRTVIIQHESFQTLYAHCSKLKVKKGDWIDKGSLLGRVGATGRATGPHLHFEIRSLDGRAIDPAKQEIASLFHHWR